MELKKRPCPSCGGTMTRGTRPETITLGGHSLTYDQPGWHCHDCDDGIIEGADNEAGDAALRRLKEMVNAASRP
jgi:HTH-type transcriptional regulator/antitoxin MqsA